MNEKTERLREKIKDILGIVEGDNAYPLEECEEEATDQKIEEIEL